MSIEFKGGVNVNGIKPEASHILIVAHSIWAEYFPGTSVTCTSALDGTHSEGSLHYEGLAIDLRTFDLPGGYLGEAAKKAVALLVHRLGNDYDVVLERTHIHVEYDPE